MTKHILTAVLLLAALHLATSCSEGETYAKQKKKERSSIRAFLADNDIVGPINVITESEFRAHDSITDVTRNEFVLFEEDGIYMQIVRRGEGQTMAEMARQERDSTVNKLILCRFLEYDIQSADTTYSNKYAGSVVDKMQCSYSQRGRSFTASFTEGYMLNYYDAVVPEGWLKPLAYLRLAKTAGREAKVRLIVPHTSGTNSAKRYVHPFFYEITYQLSPKN